MKKVLITASVLVLLALSAVAQKKGQAGRRETQIAENWIAAWNSHNAEKVIPLFTSDVMYEDVTFGAANHGQAELRKFALDFFEAVPDMKFELINSSVEGRHGSIEWVFSGTDKGIYKTGKKFTVRGVSIVNLDKEKISRNLDFYDSATIMRQVGLLPATETAPKN